MNSISSSFELPTINTKNIERYNKSINQGISPQKAFEKASKGASKATIKLMQSAGNGAVTTEALASATQKATIAAKAGQTALKGLSMAGNMLASMAIMWVVGEVINYFTELSQAAEKASQQAEEFTNNYKQTQSEYASSAQTISQLSNEYKNLSSQVDIFGKSSTLSTTELENYHDMTNQLAEIMPELVSYWDDEGNAVMKFTGNLVDATETYKKYLQQRAQDSYNEKNEDGDYVVDSVFDDWNNFNDIGFLSYGNPDEDLYKRLENAKISQKDGYWDSSNETDDFGYSAWVDLAQDLGSDVYDRFSKQFSEPISNYSADKLSAFFDQEILNLEEKFSQHAGRISSATMTYAQSTDGYSALSDDNLSIFQHFISNLTPESIVALGLDEKEGMETFVNRMINDLNTADSKLSTAMSKIMTVDSSNLNPQEKADILDENIPIASNYLGMSQESFKELYDIEEYNSLADLYGNSIKASTTQLKNTNEEDIKNIFSQASIDTKDEIERWNKIVAGTSSATEALKIYNQEKVNSTKNNTAQTEDISNIYSLDEGFSKLRDIFTDVENGEEFNWGNILNNEDFEKQFNVDGVKDKYSKFIQTVSKSPGDINACKSAFNELATAYLYNSDALSNVTEANKEASIQMLEQMGIANAEEIVTQQIAKNKIDAQIASVLFSQSTEGEINALGKELTALTNGDTALTNYIMQKSIANAGALDTQESVSSLIALAEQCGYSGDAIKELVKLEKLYNEYKVLDADENTSPEILAAKEQEINKQKKKTDKASKKGTTNTDTNFNGNSNNNSNTPTSTKQSTPPTTFDWIERKINSAADRTKRTVDSITNYITQKTKNKRYSTLLKNIDKEIEVNDKAAKKYKAKANKIAKDNNISKDTIKKIKNGDFSITDIDSENAEAINEFISYYEKSQNAKQTAREKRQEKLEKAREATNSKIEFRNNRLEQKRSEADSIQANIDIAESRGVSGTVAQYNDLINNANKQKSNLKAQNEILNNYLKENNIKKKSAEWFDVNKQIDENNASIKDLTKSQVEWNRSIEEMKLNRFEYLNTILGNIKSKYEALTALHEAQGKEMSVEEIFRDIKSNDEQMEQNKKESTNTWDRIKTKATAAANDPSGWGWGLSATEFQTFKTATERYRNKEITEDEYKSSISSIFMIHGLSYTSDIMNNTDLNENLTKISELAIDNINLMADSEQLLDSLREKAVQGAQDYVDKLREANEAKSKAIELEKIQQKLQAAKQNKTTLVYREGYGFNYEADTDAIDEAQMELDEYQFNALMDAMDDFIEALENVNMNIYDENSHLIMKDENGNAINIFDKTGKALLDIESVAESYINTFKSIAEKYGITNASFTENDKGGYDLSSTVTDPYATNTAYALSSLASDNMSILSRIQQRIEESIKSIDSITQGSGNNSNSVNIQNVSLPNINDASTAIDLINELVTLSSSALQASNKNK